ncbi:MAG: hypothetical protein BGO31_19560 [Bacteroidetes bacterium 43-16]|nr:MAG: hypothetical protein BGO31_19560 [Bacteroidetes bacterium 43-16]
MNQYEVADEIAAVIPEVKTEISRLVHLKNPFALIRIITRHTRKMVEQHNELMTDKCMKLIDSIYRKGDLMIKNAIENVFIFSLDNIFFTCPAGERKQVIRKVPAGLYALYVKQVYKSGL